MKRTRILAAVLLVAAGSGVAGIYAQARADLTVVITELKSGAGELYIAVHDNPGSFPENSDQAIRKMIVPVEGTSVKVVFEEMLPGTIAVTFFHDTNGNRLMDRSIVGYPKESYGASNNRPGFGPPKFTDACFVLNQKDTTIHIRAMF